MEKGMEKVLEFDLFAEELTEQMDAAVAYGCLGSAGTLGSATGTFGSFGTYGSL
ncbi:thiocillin family RiPP [Brevibacillus laterosporus]|uniref:thiocillin family RiPP n=1 Tax=Brevibacillus laterosporus TaxID=1465 RepID=UPI003D191B45